MSEEEDEDDEEVELTEEQRAEKILDDENIYMQMLVPGDGLTYPVSDACVRVNAQLVYISMLLSR